MLTRIHWAIIGFTLANVGAFFRESHSTLCTLLMYASGVAMGAAVSMYLVREQDGNLKRDLEWKQDDGNGPMV